MMMTLLMILGTTLLAIIMIENSRASDRIDSTRSGRDGQPFPAFLPLLFAAPGAGEMQDWLGLSDSWLAKQLLGLADRLKEILTSGLNTLGQTLITFFKQTLQFWEQLVRHIWSGIETMYQGIQKFFDNIIEYLSKIWQQAMDLVWSFVSWLGQMIGMLWQWFKDTADLYEHYFNLLVQGLTEWLVSWYWYYLETVAERCWDTADWLIDTSIFFLEKALEKFPQMQIPGGWEEGMNLFIGYARRLDDFAPVHEMLIFMYLYLQIYVAMILYKRVRQWLPLLP